MWILSILLTIVNGGFYTPEQVHIAWTDDLTSMSVTWAAEVPHYGSLIQYTPISLHGQTVDSYIYSSPAEWITFPNRAIPKILQRHLNVCKGYISNLIPSQVYAYRVGSEVYGWSKQFSFKARKNFTDTDTARFLVYGDLSAGEENIPTIVRLDLETYDYEYDAIIHNGDFAYDLDSNQGQNGDSFMRSIEVLGSRIPYMVSQGNHESGTTLPHYLNRFQMPGNVSNLWYSFNAGKAHFIAYNTEPIFNDLNETQAQQIAFLENDLKTVDREQYPWIIVYGHRPLYCSANTTKALGEVPIERHNNDCLGDAEIVREAFENVWYKNKVDFVIGSHVHAYERLASVYQNASVPCKFENENICIGASAPVYVVTGVPGNDESYAPPSPTPLPFSKAQDGHLGYSRLTIFNSTHLLWEQVRTFSNEISDYLWLVK